LLVTLALAATLQGGPAAPALAFDHVWIVVRPGAPERAALERAAFAVSPGVNRHEGQGTASVTLDFANAFLELLWPDSSVVVSPGLGIVAQRFRQRMDWRRSGWSPIGIGFRRTGTAFPRFPFPTWSTRAEWMAPGDSLVMLTPRGDSVEPTLWIVSRSSAGAAASRGPTSLRRVTHVRLVGPGLGRTPPTAYLAGVIEMQDGADWLVDLTLDDGRAHRQRDFRPDLPLVIRW
jgi:hypothetical protein